MKVLPVMFYIVLIFAGCKEESGTKAQLITTKELSPFDKVIKHMTDSAMKKKLGIETVVYDEVEIMMK